MTMLVLDKLINFQASLQLSHAADSLDKEPMPPSQGRALVTAGM